MRRGVFGWALGFGTTVALFFAFDIAAYAEWSPRTAIVEGAPADAAIRYWLFVALGSMAVGFAGFFSARSPILETTVRSVYLSTASWMAAFLLAASLLWCGEPISHYLGVETLTGREVGLFALLLFGFVGGGFSTFAGCAPPLIRATSVSLVSGVVWSVAVWLGVMLLPLVLYIVAIVIGGASRMLGGIFSLPPLGRAAGVFLSAGGAGFGCGCLTAFIGMKGQHALVSASRRFANQ